jgi:hypothetical protein
MKPEQKTSVNLPRRWPILLTLTLLAGCERAPTFSIVGSFFPAWLFCTIAGILLAWAAHWFFNRIQIEKYIHPSILVYPCIAAFFAFTLWLVIFS